MKKRLTQMKGQYVAFTGFLWCDRIEFQRKLVRAGAIPTPKGRVNRDTNILVRGTSGVWKFGDHGIPVRRRGRWLHPGPLYLLEKSIARSGCAPKETPVHRRVPDNTPQPHERAGDLMVSENLSGGIAKRRRTGTADRPCETRIGSKLPLLSMLPFASQGV